MLTVLVAAVLRFGFFALEPPGRDQGVFSNLADGVLNGKLLYRDLWENKPPAVAWLYAAAIGLLGRSYVAIHALQAVFATLTALVVAWLVRRATGSTPASIASALLYLVHAGGVAFGGFWGTAQAEVFMDFPLALALALLLAARHATGRRTLLAAGAAGLCIGWTLLLKYSAAPLAALVLVALVRPDGSARERVGAVGAFSLGCAFPLTALAGGMWAAGAWADFYRATIAFNAAYRDATEPSRIPLAMRLLYSPARLLALYVPAAVGSIAVLWPRKQRPFGGDQPLASAAAWLWVLALGEVFWQGKFWLYHYHVILLPLALLAGIGLSRALAPWRGPARRAVASVAAAALLALLSLPYSGDVVSYDRRHGISARWRGRATAEQMEATYTWGDYEFARTKEAASAIARETAPGDRIFVWGFEPYVYFLSRREPSSRFVYDLPLMPSFTSVHPLFAAQLMDDLRRHPPARFVVVADDANDVEALDSVTQLLQLPELRAYVESQYAPAWRIGDFLCLAPRSQRVAP